MDAELKELHDFIASTAPFDRLPKECIEELTASVAIRYLRSGLSLPPKNVSQHRLYIIRKGALSLFSTEGKLIGKLGEGDICSVFCTQDEESIFSVKVDEDALLYTIPCDQLTNTMQAHPEVLTFFMESASQRLKQQVVAMSEEAIVTSTLMSTSTADMFHSPAVTIENNASIRDAAKKMTELGYSSLIILKGDAIDGIITDKDIRRRCVAAGLSPDEPVSKIMTSNIMSISRDTNAFDALMLMSRNHVHHLPVLHNGDLAGMVTVTDLIRQEGKNAVHLTGIIHKADSLDALVEASKMLPDLQVQLAKLGTTAEHVGKGITAITTALTHRLIELAEDELGPPPVPYAWVAAGSQARQEQSSHSDQDNGLIISDDMKPEDDAWFEALAKFVSDGLAACGYIYCPGNVMATNPQWRQKQSVWEGYFNKWIDTPEPMALMYSSIFFDLSTIRGEFSYLKDIRKNMLAKTQHNTLFQAHLTHNALKLSPPLGFFRDFVLVHDGEHNDTLDLKHNGIAPIVDLARIYALSEGIKPVNTIERLRLASGTPSLSKESAANLIDAFEFLGMLRIQHQAKQIQNNQQADNYLSPKDISKLEREHLKDAFKVIQSLQNSLHSKY
jgi:CBS domain-containing protein